MAETPPDFILMGQQKAATRWLYDQLRNADRFWLPPVKEITYFVGDPLGRSPCLRWSSWGRPTLQINCRPRTHHGGFQCRQ